MAQGFEANLHSSTAAAAAHVQQLLGRWDRFCKTGESLIMCELLEAKEFSKKLSKSKDESPCDAKVGGRLEL